MTGVHGLSKGDFAIVRRKSIWYWLSLVSNVAIVVPSRAPFCCSIICINLQIIFL